MDAWKIHQVENQVSRSPNWGGFLADVFWLQIPPPNKNIQSRSWYLKARSWQWSSPASWWGRNRLSQLRMTWGIFWSGGRWGNARNGNFPSREGLASFQKLVCVQDMVFHWTMTWMAHQKHTQRHTQTIYMMNVLYSFRKTCHIFRWTCSIAASLATFWTNILPNTMSGFLLENTRFCLLEMVPNDPQMIYKLEDQMVPLSVVLIPSYAFTSEKLAMSKLFQNVCWCFST